MKLLYQTHSPFARKVLVFAHEAGLAQGLEVEHHETSPTRINEAVYAQNPLGKVPVLIRPNLPPLFESDIICSYLAALSPHATLIPTDAEARLNALSLQALAHGLCQAGIGLRWETERRPIGLRYPALAEGYALKLSRTYDWLEHHIDPHAPFGLGQIALATALDWLIFRGLPCFSDRPRLWAWFKGVKDRPSMIATPYGGQTFD